MSRLEAAAKAMAPVAKLLEATILAQSALAAADAYDAAHNVHRVVLDDATVERAARALDPKAWDETAIMFVAHGQSPEDARASRQRYACADARRVLAAAVKEEQA